MNEPKKADLGRRMRTRFIDGMNYEDLMKDLVKFIDTNYEAKQVKEELIKERKLIRYNKELLEDIRKNGGFVNWKRQFKKA